MIRLMLLLLLAGCATTEEKLQACADKGMGGRVHTSTFWMTTCDCDSPTTFIEDCPTGGTVMMMPGQGACGVLRSSSVECYDLVSPKELSEGRSLSCIISETCED